MKEFQFTQQDIDTISKVLEVEPVKRVDHHRFVIENTEDKRKLSLEIYPAIVIGSETGFPSIP